MTGFGGRAFPLAVLAFLILAATPPASPAQESAEEVSAGLEALSPEERAALLELMGRPPAPETGVQRDTSTPELMRPRPQAEEGDEAEMEVPADSLAADSLLGPTPSFESFLEPPGEDEAELLPFGYELFRLVPSTFAPATDIPVTPDYMLGPGDELHIRLYGRDQASASPVIDRDGLIDFPELGPLSVAGLTFAEMREKLAAEVEDRLVGTEVSVTMGRLRSIQVFVLGDVVQPGAYTLSALSTMSHALFLSGGIGEVGSLRRVQLKRGGELVGELDLYDMLLNGDSSGDLRLQSMDVLFVPPAGPRAGVRGEVLRPARYEFKPGLSAAGLIEMAGGLKPAAFPEYALLERVEDGRRTAYDFPLDEAARWELADGDLLRVFAAPERPEEVVWLEGNVDHPGMRRWDEGMRLSDLLPSHRELKPESYFDYGLIEREDPLTGAPGYLSWNPGALLLRGEAQADLPLMPRDRVFVFHRGHFRETPKVIVAGEVRSPGEYRYRDGMRVLDLILAAGGLTHDAMISRAELLRTEPENKRILGRQLDLEGVLAADPEHNVELMDLDTLKIHSVWEIRERPYVEILGEVNNPGRYPLFEGMRVSDLIFAGGNTSERAYVTKAELTRFTVVDGERRELWRLDVSLRDALAGDPAEDIQLQPYDNLLVQRLSNWRGAERVRVTGEVAFPGNYPIEEGERLSDLISRFGGFLKDAYLPAAVFTRESVREVQEQQFERMAEQLEGDLARFNVAEPGSSPDEIAKKRAALEAGQALVQALRETEAVGRLVIQLEDVEALRDSEFDLQLQNGDHLHVPKLNEFVMVMGQVHNPMAFKYRGDWDVDEYIEQAGGKSRFADDKMIYVVRADGSVASRRKNLEPGDVIVVPQTLERFDAMEFAMDLSQVLYQVGLAAAAAQSVGLFN